MANALFITGASGFIGRHLLQKIDLTKYKSIYCLSRTPSRLLEPFNSHPTVHFLRGSLYDWQVYAPYLASSSTVVHLAAATGKAMPETYFAVNTKATQFFVEQCKRAGVQNFLYASTIAVKFPDTSRYYYAQSKKQGEVVVKHSGLRYCIVRPTIVLGKDAPLWKGLLQLSRGPITLVFGKGTTRIQPIHVDDLIDCLLSILYEDIFSYETFELGGPEEITFERFLKKIRYIYSGDNPWFVLHIPLKPLVKTLSLLEKRFYSLLPLNVGQLSAFRYPGTIETNRLFRRHVSQMKNVGEMLRQVTHTS